MSEHKQIEMEQVVAKNKEDLLKIIKDTIKKNGNNCDLNFIDVSSLTDLSGLFSGNVTRKFNGDISKWNVSNVTNMSHMFEKSKFNGNISNWNVSNVEDMEGMFAESKFNGDISKWDVSNVRNMSDMFYSPTIFNRSKFNGDISKWDVSNVKSMAGMFSNSKFTGDISRWNLRKKDLNHHKSNEQ